MKQSKIIASCGMMAALSIVILVLGTVLEIGVYAAPMFAGLCLLPIGHSFGRTYQLLLWLTVSLLGFLLVPNLEENLMYLCLFGFYPIVYPAFQRLPQGLRLLSKLLYFNAVTILLELLLIKLLMPESMGLGFAALLLTLGNITFLCYDFILPRATGKLGKALTRIIK